MASGYFRLRQSAARPEVASNCCLNRGFHRRFPLSYRPRASALGSLDHPKRGQAYLLFFSATLRKRALALGSLLWLVAMALILASYPRYRVNGPPLLSSGFETSFALEPERVGAPQWVKDRDNVFLRLEGGHRARLSWEFPFKGGESHLHMRCRIRTQGLIPGASVHEKALVTVYIKDARGRDIASLPNYGFLAGDHDWRWLDHVILIPEGTRSLHVMIRNLGQAGQMDVDDFLLEPVADHLDFRLVQVLMLLGVFYFVGRWLQQIGVPRNAWALLLAGLLVMVVFSSICSRAQIVAMSRWAGSVLAPARDVHVEQPERKSAKKPAALPSLPQSVPLTKRGHFLFYGLAALFLVLWARPKRDRIPAFVALFVFLASATEILQIPEVGRTPHLLDWALDLGGALCGTLVALALCRLLRLGQGFFSVSAGSR